MSSIVQKLRQEVDAKYKGRVVELLSSQSGVRKGICYGTVGKTRSDIPAARAISNLDLVVGDSQCRSYISYGNVVVIKVLQESLDLERDSLWLEFPVPGDVTPSCIVRVDWQDPDTKRLYLTRLGWEGNNASWLGEFEMEQLSFWGDWCKGRFLEASVWTHYFAPA